MKLTKGYLILLKYPVTLVPLIALEIRNLGDHNAELYRNRKQFFFLSVQAIFNGSFLFQNIVVKRPESFYNSTIFNNLNICTKFEHGDFKDSFLSGDSGYALRYVLIKFLNLSSPAETFQQ